MRMVGAPLAQEALADTIVGTLTKNIAFRTSVLAVAAVIISVASVATAGAQSLTPGSDGAGLQSQTGQTQQTTNSLNQTGGLQNNNTQPALNDNGVRPLGVVSDPSQTTPDAVAQPTGTLKTDITPTESSNTSWIIAGIVVLLGIAAVIFWTRTGSRMQAAESAQIESAPVVKPEPIKPRKKRSNTPKKKRKKSSRR